MRQDGVSHNAGDRDALPLSTALPAGEASLLVRAAFERLDGHDLPRITLDLGDLVALGAAPAAALLALDGHAPTGGAE